MLTPNPYKPGSIARVVIINSDAVRPLVVHVDPFYEQPALLRTLNPGYVIAIRFWNWIAVSAAVAGIALAILWHWWAVIVGLVAAFFVQRMNRRSVADFVVQSVIEQKEAALSLFNSHKLMWVASPDQLVRDRA